ncbi:hypothetical protein [Blastochloris sulfoviridis]|uniref:hypothetical protein n=1 Tax=Blastochloris sulfoviridis TaxID=50712 RepID=UPI001FE270BD|nr:hypothetical protein [Blastochloris sulfoviridis]
MTDNNNHFNPIFDKLVNAEHPQVAEMVAYCLYKIRKREWATDFFAKNGRKPNDEELAAYVAMWTPSLIEGTRQQATGIVNSFAASVLDENAPKIREDALRGTFLRAVSTSIVASFFYTLLLIGVVIVGQIAGVDIASIWSAISGVASKTGQ